MNVFAVINVNNKINNYLLLLFLLIFCQGLSGGTLYYQAKLLHELKQNKTGEKKIDDKKIDDKKVDEKKTDDKKVDGKKTDGKKTDGKKTDEKRIDFSMREFLNIGNKDF